jgi:hypothetical protein
MPVPIPERFQRIIESVRASTFDTMIDHLAAGDGRLKTSLIIERELCRDPLMRAFAEAFDEQHRLHDQLREAVQADAGEAVIDALSIRLEQSHWRAMQALRKIEVGDCRA